MKKKLTVVFLVIFTLIAQSGVSFYIKHCKKSNSFSVQLDLQKKCGDCCSKNSKPEKEVLFNTENCCSFFKQNIKCDQTLRYQNDPFKSQLTLIHLHLFLFDTCLYPSLSPSFLSKITFTPITHLNSFLSVYRC